MPSRTEVATHSPGGGSLDPPRGAGADDGAREALDHGVMLERGGNTERALAAYAEAMALATTPETRAEAYRRTADVHRTRSEWGDAVAAARTSARIARRAGLSEPLAEALNAEAGVYLLRGSVASATALLEEALTLDVGDRVRGILLQNLGMGAARSGDPQTARRRFRESADCFERVGYERGALIALNNTAAADIEYGDPAAAIPVLEEAASIARRLQDLDLLLLTVRNSAEAMSRCDRLSEALALVTEAIGFFATESNALRRAECLMILGDIHERQSGSRDETASRCYELARSIAREIGAHALLRQLDARDEAAPAD
jgi:tetratricopeptide (TPR) repeat protein